MGERYRGEKIDFALLEGGPLRGGSVGATGEGGVDQVAVSHIPSLIDLEWVVNLCCARVFLVLNIFSQRLQDREIPSRWLFSM